MNDEPKTKVLFLCTGNSCRSQMSEAWLRELGGERFAVFSAGLEPHGVHPLTIKVMEETGYDMSDHRSKHLEEFIGEINFDYLITVCGNADERCHTSPAWGSGCTGPLKTRPPSKALRSKNWPSSARCAARSKIKFRAGSNQPIFKVDT